MLYAVHNANIQFHKKENEMYYQAALLYLGARCKKPCPFEQNGCFSYLALNPAYTVCEGRIYRTSLALCVQKAIATKPMLESSFSNAMLAFKDASGFFPVPNVAIPTMEWKSACPNNGHALLEPRCCRAMSLIHMTDTALMELTGSEHVHNRISLSIYSARMFILIKLLQYL